jgi:hypothetical protein
VGTRGSFPGGKADHSSPSSAEVKNAWSCTSTPPYVFMAWCLVKHRDNFTFFYLYCTMKLFTQLVSIRTLAFTNLPTYSGRI